MSCFSETRTRVSTTLHLRQTSPNRFLAYSCRLQCRRNCNRQSGKWDVVTFNFGEEEKHCRSLALPLPFDCRLMPFLVVLLRRDSRLLGQAVCQRDGLCRQPRRDLHQNLRRACTRRHGRLGRNHPDRVSLLPVSHTLCAPFLRWPFLRLPVATVETSRSR